MVAVAGKTIWTLRNYEGDGNKNVKKKVVGLISETTTLHMHQAFSNFLCKDLK